MFAGLRARFISELLLALELLIALKFLFASAGLRVLFKTTIEGGGRV